MYSGVTPEGNESFWMVRVRYLRTQQRAKSQCTFLKMHKPRQWGWFVFVAGWSGYDGHDRFCRRFAVRELSLSTVRDFGRGCL
jgi:hypothetical protein